MTYVNKQDSWRGANRKLDPRELTSSTQYCLELESEFACYTLLVALDC